jgi:hypothetical protein
MLGTTNCGMVLRPSDDFEIRDLSRVATTYYHRKGPVGICLERFNWFSDWNYPPADPLDVRRGEQGFRRFDSDNRIIASMVVSSCPVPGANPAGLPAGALVAAWSEPPYAVIGLGAGTMASYGRPFQTVHFYEIDERLRDLVLPSEGRQDAFGFVKGALDRGTNVKVLPGDPRWRMAMPWIPERDRDKGSWQIDFDKRGGPEYFYHLLVVDAVHSDALLLHLLTREALQMYVRHLAVGYWLDLGKPGHPGYRDKKEFEQHGPGDFRIRFLADPHENKIWVPGGVVCVHITHRRAELLPLVVDTAATVEWDDLTACDAAGKPQRKKGLVAVRGFDSAPGNEGLHRAEDIGHLASKWVIVARDSKDLWHLKPPPNYDSWIDEARMRARDPGKFSPEGYWQAQAPFGRYLWTDRNNPLAIFFH